MTETSKQEYDDLAAIYDRRWRHYVEATVRRTLAVLSIGGNERVLDVGCGTGSLLRELERRHPGLKLHGVDPSREMLKIARQKCGNAVVLDEGAAEVLPYPESEFDLTVSVSALHFFADARKALSEMRRVLRPGGTLAIADWCADFCAMRALGLWLRLRNAPLGRIYRLSELQLLLEETGFEITRAERFRIHPLWGMMVVTAHASPAARLG